MSSPVATDDAVTRVRRGGALLDQRGPADWRVQLDRSTLDLGDPTYCVLAQLYRHDAADTFNWLGVALSQLGLWSTSDTVDEFDQVVIEHGFEEPVDGDYDALTRAWLAYLDEPVPDDHQDHDTERKTT